MKALCMTTTCKLSLWVTCALWALFAGVPAHAQVQLCTTSGVGLYNAAGSVINPGATLDAALQTTATAPSGTANMYLTTSGTATTAACLRNDGTIYYTYSGVVNDDNMRYAVRAAAYNPSTGTGVTNVQLVNTGTINVVNPNYLVTSYGGLSFSSSNTTASLGATGTNNSLYNFGTIQTADVNGQFVSTYGSVRAMSVASAGWVNEVMNASTGMIQLTTTGNNFSTGMLVSGRNIAVLRLTNNGVINSKGYSSVQTLAPAAPSGITIWGQSAAANWNATTQTGVYVDNVLNTGTINASANGGTNAAYGIYLYYTNAGTITNTGTITSTGSNATYLSTNIQLSGAGVSVGTLNNLQGAAQGAALTYSGLLPSNYNAIIYSPGNYGQLKGVLTTAITGSALNLGSTPMNFGIYGSRGASSAATLAYNTEYGTYVAASSTSNGASYAGVLQGLSSSNLAALSGKYYNAYSGVYNWQLTPDSVVANTWNLATDGGGAYIHGYLFNDGGAPSAGSNTGTPNDSIKNGNESGLAGYTVNLTDCASTLYGSVSTDANGYYRFVSPMDALNHSVWRNSAMCVQADVPQGYTVTGASAVPSTGASVGVGTAIADGVGALVIDNVGYQYVRSQQRVNFTTPNDDAFQLRVDFAQVPGSALVSPSTQMAASGTVVTHAHRFKPGTGGTLNLSTLAGQATPAGMTGWREAIYLDAGCTGGFQNGATLLYASDTGISTPVTVQQGVDVCFVVREMVHAAASNGASYRVPVQAVLAFGGGSALSLTLTVADTTLVSATPVTMVKQVRNVTNSSAWAATNTAKSGETLEYQVTFTNIGASPIDTIVINENTTNWTTWRSASAGTLPSGLTCTTMKTPTSPGGQACATLSGSGKGALSWSFGGALSPGQSGVVTYQVTVD